MAFEPGTGATVEHVVEDVDTASHHGSGDVEVLATPALVALCERAAVEAVAGSLEPGKTTVGSRIDLEHLAPTPPGGTVTVTARLEGVEGRILEFLVEASDETGPIGRGRHHRVVLDRDTFEERARSRR